MPKPRTGEGTPEASPERLIGREFADVRAGILLSWGEKGSRTVWWMPVGENFTSGVAELSGTITGVDSEDRRWSDSTVSLRFDRTDPLRDVTVEHRLVISKKDVAEFETRLS